jgi:hypothetical protein
MFEMAYMYFAFGVILVLIPCVFLLSAQSFRAIKKAVIVIFQLPVLIMQTGFNDTAKHYRKQIPCSNAEYAGILFVITLNLGILFFGFSGGKPWVFTAIGWIFAIDVFLFGVHMMLEVPPEDKDLDATKQGI